MHFSKIVGDLIQGFSLKAAAVATACVVGHEVYEFLIGAFAPVLKVLAR